MTDRRSGTMNPLPVPGREAGVVYWKVERDTRVEHDEDLWMIVEQDTRKRLMSGLTVLGAEQLVGIHNDQMSKVAHELARQQQKVAADTVETAEIAYAVTSFEDQRGIDRVTVYSVRRPGQERPYIDIRVEGKTGNGTSVDVYAELDDEDAYSLLKALGVLYGVEVPPDLLDRIDGDDDDDCCDEDDDGDYDEDDIPF